MALNGAHTGPSWGVTGNQTGLHRTCGQSGVATAGKTKFTSLFFMTSDESPKGNMVYSDEKVGSKSAKLTISCLHNKGAIKKGEKLIIKNSKKQRT